MAMGFEIVHESEAEQGPIHLRDSYLAAVLREKQAYETQLEQAKSAGAPEERVKFLKSQIAACATELGQVAEAAEPRNKTAK